jgi:hypothetical protein
LEKVNQNKIFGHIKEMEQFETHKTPKYPCDSCNFKTSNKKDYNRHLLTAKHINETNVKQMKQLNPNMSHDIIDYRCGVCCCNFSSRTTLWRHKKVCKLEENVNSSNADTNIILQLIKQNDNFKNLILDQTKIFMEQNTKIIDTFSEAIKHNSITNNNTNNTVNSNNKTFNLQVFLNEDCKDAMNINEFIESINFQLSDLEHMGEVGYVEGISNIIIKNLKGLDVTKRPVHCTDQKRETIYIKDGGVWTKEDEDNKNVRKMIKRVAFRNSKSIRLFKEKHPDCTTSESKYSDTYNKIVLEAMGGGSKCNDYDSETKIIKKISKVVTIDRSTF